VIVVDTSVLIAGLVDVGAVGQAARARLAKEQTLLAPELLYLEVLSVLRGLVRGRKLSTARAADAVTDLVDLPLRATPHRELAGRCWELRDALSPYDAAFVATAELFAVPLVTSDARLAGATGIRCTVEVLHA
jgi:predicted nucleic acid-binding protein